MVANFRFLYKHRKSIRHGRLGKLHFQSSENHFPTHPHLTYPAPPRGNPTRHLRRVLSRAQQAHHHIAARHFDKVIWNLPIPRYDPKLKLHRNLAAAGAEAEAAAKLVELVDGEKFQRARKRVRDALIGNGIAAKIETLVEKLLDGS